MTCLHFDLDKWSNMVVDFFSVTDVNVLKNFYYTYNKDATVKPC